MHRVLPPVGGSLAFEDPYQEMVLDPRVKNEKEGIKSCTNKPTTNHLWWAPPLLVLHTRLQTKKGNWTKPQPLLLAGVYNNGSTT